MSKVTSFNRSNLSNVRKELDKALAAFTKTTGVAVNVGSIRFTDNEFTTRLTCRTTTNTTVNGQVAQIDQVLAAKMAQYNLGLKGTSGEKLTGFTPRRPKYPFSYTGPRGGRYKCSIEQAKRMFAK